MEKTRYFPTLIRGDGGYVIQLKCPNYFWLGLSERNMRGVFERICDSGDRDIDKGERHGISKLDFGLITHCFFLETENNSFTLT